MLSVLQLGFEFRDFPGRLGSCVPRECRDALDNRFVSRIVRTDLEQR